MTIKDCHKFLRFVLAVTIGLLTLNASAAPKPNILVIWGDDIGMYNISAYNHGMMG